MNTELSRSWVASARIRAGNHTQRRNRRKDHDSKKSKQSHPLACAIRRATGPTINIGPGASICDAEDRRDGITEIARH